MIDTHCHLENEQFDKDLDSVVGRAQAAGVQAIITSALGNDIDKGLKIAAKFPNYVFLTAGIAPAEIAEDYMAHLDKIEANISKIVGVGEVGLDFYWVRDHETRDLQREAFRKAIQLAKKHKLPVVVHSRSAGRYALEILNEEEAEKVQLHAFDGAVRHAADAIINGWMFSIPISVLYAPQKQDLVKELPIDNLLLETDSPVIAPERGKRNEPANIHLAAEKIAELKKMDVSTVVEVTDRNAKKLFNLQL